VNDTEIRLKYARGSVLDNQ